MELAVLFSLLITILFIGALEYSKHQKVIQSIPHRIHINGSRGKSSVTRLIAAGLRFGGIKTLAKTTGSAPRIIDDKGEDHMIHRLRSPSIGEQIKLLKLFSNSSPDAIVIECMAVQPEYQWVTEQKMMKSTIGVITNVRPDHLDEMGYDLLSIASSLSNTIPYESNFITGEEYINSPLKEISINRNTEYFQTNADSIPKEYMNNFPYLEHSENISIALKVCELVGIKKEVALEGMTHTKPDPGALEIIKMNIANKYIYFVNAFAANDPHSTLMIWNMIKERMTKQRTCIFLNTRKDRLYRTKQLIDLCYNKLIPSHLIIRGENIQKLIPETTNNIKLEIFSDSSNSEEIIEFIKNLDNYYVMGIGNIVGWGDNFIKELKLYE